jgi:hypothetical protein
LEKLVDAVPGVARSRARWDLAILDVWVTPDAEVSDDALRSAILRANLTPGERLR